MPSWELWLTIIILSLGLALAGLLARVAWLFCQGNGEIERRPWEE